MNLTKIIIAFMLSIPSIVAESIPTTEYVTEQTHISQIVVGQPIYEYVELAVCHYGTAKTYMDWQKINPTSKQGKFIMNNMLIQDGLLYDSDGYIGVALGSYFGEIGDRFIFTLSSGIVLRLIKIEEKSDQHTINGCQQRWDKSVIEFVIDEDTHNFPYFSNKYIANGNFNNLPQFNGSIVKILKQK